MMPLTVRTAQNLLAHNVRVLRETLGITQEALGQQAGIATRHIQKIEAAKVNLTLSTLAKLSAALQVDVAGLFTPIRDS